MRCNRLRRIMKKDTPDVNRKRFNRIRFFDSLDADLTVGQYGGADLSTRRAGCERTSHRLSDLGVRERCELLLSPVESRLAPSSGSWRPLSGGDGAQHITGVETAATGRQDELPTPQEIVG